MTWPFENDTSAITKKLAKNSLKSGKMRNLLIILTISLSIALMSGLALYIASMQTANSRQLENLQQVFFYDITEQQCDTLRLDSRISEMRVTKYGKRSEIENYVIWPMYIEQSEGKIQSAEISEGQYPSAENEIAVDVSYLERIGENLEIGDTISFSFYDGTQESFVLSGLTDTGSTSDVYPVYFSEQYAETGGQLKDTLFVAAAQIQEAKSMTANEFLDTIHAIGADCGIERPSIGENSAFVQSLTFNPKNMLIAVCIGLVVLFAGVVVIYSIFYISIINRIQYFGQLRTIGTTGKQIKRIVKREGTLLFCIGAPSGLAMGSIFVWILNSEDVYKRQEVDYKKHRTVINTPTVNLTVVGVKNYSEAETVARELSEHGVKAIELCAGFGNEGIARISKAVKGMANVGAVKFDLHPGFDFKSGDELF